MDESIQIIEKPDWVSWENIRTFLIEAHSVNREKGINMSHYQWPAEKIQESLGENGRLFVALDGRKIVGTAAIGEKIGAAWYNKGRFGYMCYAGVHPDYKGKGIYKALTEKREEEAKSMNYPMLLLDTHSQNRRIQTIAEKNGYRFVHFFRAQSNDHYSVVMVKWLSVCPYSRFYCEWRYLFSKAYAILRTSLLSMKKRIRK